MIFRKKDQIGKLVNGNGLVDMLVDIVQYSSETLFDLRYFIACGSLEPAHQ